MNAKFLLVRTRGFGYKTTKRFKLVFHRMNDKGGNLGERENHGVPERKKYSPLKMDQEVFFNNNGEIITSRDEKRFIHSNENKMSGKGSKHYFLNGDISKKLGIIHGTDTSSPLNLKTNIQTEQIGKVQLYKESFFKDKLTCWPYKMHEQNGTKHVQLLMFNQKDFLHKKGPLKLIARYSTTSELNVLPLRNSSLEWQKENVPNNDMLIRKMSKECKSSCDEAISSWSNLGESGLHKYHEDLEKGVNDQIQAEFKAAFDYLSMATYFGHVCCSLPGAEAFFTDMYEEELGHAKIFIDYQILRGGSVKLKSIIPPEKSNWINLPNAFKVALQMEKDIKDKLVDLHNVGEKHKDPSITDFITTKFMPEQDRSIYEMTRLMVRACKMKCCGCTEFLFDRELLEISRIKRKQEKKEDDSEKSSKMYL